jgi:hypothetical protein
MPTSKLICLLLLTVVVFSQVPSYRGQQEIIECEGCRQSPIDLPPLQEASTPPPDVVNKWDLWTHGTLLRGANVWQKCLGTDDAPCTSFETSYDNLDFEKLKAWGANYVNISYPGIFSEKPIRDGGRGPLAYRKVETALSNLIRLIDLCSDNKLFVVVSFRTGPGRNEAVFDKDESNPITTLWQTEHGALTAEAAAAQDAWVEMWREAACRLKSKPNVIGYDLIVEPQQEREQQEGVNKQEMWFALAQRLVEAIRCEDKRTPILIGGAAESSACKLSCINPDRFSRYGRIVYTAHQYHPYDEYTHQPNKHAKYKCERNVAKSVSPGWRAKHRPRAFDTWVAGEMYKRYQYIYGFKVGRGVQIAVNEFGVVRYAGTPDKPDAHQAITYEMNLSERMGANHALWLWETWACITYDDMNFKHGVNPKKHADLTPDEEAQDTLVRAIKENWGRNKIYATPALLDKIGAEVAPLLPTGLVCPSVDACIRTVDPGTRHLQR